MSFCHIDQMDCQDTLKNKFEFNKLIKNPFGKYFYVYDSYLYFVSKFLY